MLDEVLNRQPNRHAAYVGAAAFAHKAGLHASAIAKDPATYEHVEPQAVGNERVTSSRGTGGNRFGSAKAWSSPQPCRNNSRR